VHTLKADAHLRQVRRASHADIDGPVTYRIAFGRGTRNGIAAWIPMLARSPRTAAALLHDKRRAALPFWRAPRRSETADSNRRAWKTGWL